MNSPEGNQADAGRCLFRNGAVRLRVVLPYSGSHLDQGGTEKAHSCCVEARKCPFVGVVGTELAPEGKDSENEHNSRPKQTQPAKHSPQNALSHRHVSLVASGCSKEGSKIEERPRHCLCQGQASKENRLVHPARGHHLVLKQWKHHLATAPDHGPCPPKCRKPKQTLEVGLLEYRRQDIACHEHKGHKYDEHRTTYWSKAKMLHPTFLCCGNCRGL
mmetsp:Transcript_60636/g.144499  ORF Transcript_60636/g.144499 Transcript_60636/m.144499 type:complete len:217 (-) Transcript_60636:686-1336(-)